MRRFRQLLVLSAIMLTLPVSAEIYRWTDDAGNTHFGSNPPTGMNAEPVTTGRTNTVETSSEQSAEKDAEKEAKSADQQSKQKPDPKRKEIRQQNCEAAREALTTLDQNARVQVMEDGERRYLSPEEKAAERERFETIRDENCD